MSNSFLFSTTAYKKIYLEAILFSAYYEVCLKKSWNKKINLVQRNQEEANNYKGNTLMLMTYVKSVIDIIEKKMPWKPRCYNRALTAKRILRKRGIETSMIVGFRKKDNELDGHAWLTFNDQIVTGYVAGISNFKIVSDKKVKKEIKFEL